MAFYGIAWPFDGLKWPFDGIEWPMYGWSCVAFLVFYEIFDWSELFSICREIFPKTCMNFEKFAALNRTLSLFAGLYTRAKTK